MPEEDCPACGHPMSEHSPEGPPDHGTCNYPECECWIG